MTYISSTIIYLGHKFHHVPHSESYWTLGCVPTRKEVLFFHSGLSRGKDETILQILKARINQHCDLKRCETDSFPAQRKPDSLELKPVK